MKFRQNLSTISLLPRWKVDY